MPLVSDPLLRKSTDNNNNNNNNNNNDNASIGLKSRQVRIGLPGGSTRHA